MISSTDLIEINKRFDKGHVVNKSSLNFAISSSKRSKDWITQLAYLVRAILIDHIFEEGNKRTATVLISSILEIHKVAYDPIKLDKLIVKIVTKNTKNIIDIAIIRRLIKDAIR